MIQPAAMSGDAAAPQRVSDWQIDAFAPRALDAPVPTAATLIPAKFYQETVTRHLQEDVGIDFQHDGQSQEPNVVQQLKLLHKICHLMG